MAAGEDKGTITWTLEGTTCVYSAGTPLLLALRVSNPTASARDYQLIAALYDRGTGALIPDTAETLWVAGADRLSVEGNSYQDVEASIVLDRTDVILGITLFDIAEGGVDDLVSATMVSPVLVPAAEVPLAVMAGLMVGMAGGTALALARK
jgi:hypothetical protein